MDKRLEKNLLKQAEALANFGIWELDLATNKLYWSDGVYKICGFMPQEFEVTFEIGLSVIHPDDRAKAIEHMQNTLVTGQPYEIRKRFITKDKTIKHINAKAELIKDANGKPIKLYGVFQDITNLYALENSLKTKNSDLKALVENTPDIIYSIDLDFNILTFNSSFKKTIEQLGLGEVKIGKNVFELYTNQKRELYSAVILLAKNGERYTFEDELILNGELIIYDAAVNPIRDDDDKVIGISIFAKDITLKKQKEKELERIKNNQEYIINGTSDLIWSIDANMQLLTANSAFYKSIREATGVIIKEGDYILLPEFPDNVIKKWMAFYQRGLNGESFTANYDDHTASKPTYQVISFSPMYNANHEVWGLACYTKNITKETINILKLEKKDVELEKIMDSSMDIICTIDEFNKFVKVSAAALKILGYKAKELIGKHYLDLVYHEDHQKTIEIAKSILAGNNTNSFENRYVCKNGQIAPIIWSARWDNKDKIMYCTGKDATEIKLKELELEKANHILRNAQRLGQIGNYELNLETKEVHCSDEIYHIFEIDNRLNRITSFQDFLNIAHPDDLAILQQFRSQITETGKAYTLLYRIITKENKLKYVRHVVELVYDDKTKSNWHFGTFRDSTTNILAQKGLENSEEKYRYLFDNNPAAMYVFDFETLKIIDCNQEALELYGYTKKEFLNLTIKDIRPAEDIPLIVKAVKSEESYGQVHKETWRHKKKNKKLIYVNINGHLINFEGRRCSLVQVTNITEKLKIELAIKTSEKQRELIMNAALDAMVCIDKAGTVTFWNPQAEKTFGWSGKEVLGENLTQMIIPQAHRKAYNAGLKQYLITQECPIINKLSEFTAINKQGIEFPVEATIKPIEQGDDEFFCLFIKDITTRKAAENEILESNQRFKYVTQATSDIIWDWDLSTDLIFWGDNFITYFGYEKTAFEASGISWQNKIHPDDYERVLKSIHQCIHQSETEDNWIEEYRFLKADGKYAYVLDKGILIRNDKGEAIRMVGAMQDITKRKAEDLRLKLLESVITNANDAVLITEAKPFDQLGHRIIYVNEAFTKMTGYTANEVIGKTPKILQGPKSDKNKLKRLSASLKKMEVCETTIVNYKKNGEEFYINMSISPVADANGLFTHLIAIERDVTESVFAQQKLLASYEERNTILESIDNGFFATDKNSLVTYWNQKAEVLLGAKSEQVMGKNLHKMFAKPNSMVFHNHYRKAIKENKTVHFEEYSVRSKKWFEVSAFTSDSGLSVYFKDTTEKKKAESKLVALNQMLLKQTKELALSNQELEQFAYVASHDLQEPLRMVTSFLIQIEKKYGEILDEKGKQYIYYAVDGAKRMRQIILDLLEFSKVGKNAENLEKIDVKEILEDIKSLYRKQIEERNAEITISSLPNILSYKTPIRQVLQNIISNALKYQKTYEAIKIIIKVTETENFWQFSVQDNGIGIDEEDYQKIFIIFQRLHSKDDYSGTGMGLSICKKIIENLGGQIWVNSIIGVGSTFYFTIQK